MFKNSNFDEHQYETYDGLRKMIVNEIPDEKYKNILEIGCGCGHMTNELACKFSDASVLGIDIVEDYINTAKQIYRKYTNLKFECTSYNDLKQNYDVVVFFNSFTELLKKECYNKIIKGLTKLCSDDALIVLAEEFQDDYVKELRLTKDINQLIGYKYLRLKTLLKNLNRYEIVKNKVYDIKGQNLNIEGIAHYISYECMLNDCDNTFKLTPKKIWNKVKKRIFLQGYMKINSKIRLCIFRRV